MKLFRPEFVDWFQCIADRCNYTCCRGWDIIIDDATYKTHGEAYETLCPNCFFDNEKGIHYITRKEDSRCPLLTENGLCRVVTEYGEDALSYTCKIFPRMIMGEYDDTLEYSLDNGCPAVLDLLRHLKPPMQFVVDDSGAAGNGLEYPADIVKHMEHRNQMIDLLQISDMPLWIRLYWIYDFSLHFDNMERLQEYNRAEWLLDGYRRLHAIDVDLNAKLALDSRLFQLFCIGDGYYYNKHIVYLKEFLEKQRVDDMAAEWNEFGRLWELQTGFMENFCVNYVFVRSLKGEVHKNILLLLYEVILIEFTCFLQWLYGGKNLSSEDMSGIVCYYSRTFDHNQATLYQWLDVIREYEIIKKGAILLMLK